MTEEYEGFGLWRECLPPVGIAWGFRALFKNGEIDILPTNCSWNGVCVNLPSVRRAFAEHVNEALTIVRRRVRRMYRSGELNVHSRDVHCVFEDKALKIIVSTNGYHGYLYGVTISKVQDPTKN
jgi:hypothetical protein